MSHYPLPRYTGEEPCRTSGDPDLWFAEPGRWSKANEAKAKCQACPLRDACLDYALHVSVQGVWGGTSELQRRRMRKQLGIVAEPVIATESEMKHEEMRRKYRAGVGPRELAREYRMSNRHVQRICTELAEAS